MNHHSLIVFAVVALHAASAATASAAQTMRVDYYHTGNSKEERFSLDRIVIEPLPWAGNPSRPLDDTNLGKYFFEVIDAETGKTIYSRGFSSIYGEWETTAEAGSIIAPSPSLCGFRRWRNRHVSSSRSATRRTPFNRSGRSRWILPTSSS